MRTAGIAVGLTDVAGAHCLAEAIGGLYGHPHGYCCASSMPPIMEYNLPVSTDKYARLAQAFALGPGGGEEELARLAIEFIRQLNRDLGVPPMRQLIRGAPNEDSLTGSARAFQHSIAFRPLPRSFGR